MRGYSMRLAGRRGVLAAFALAAAVAVFFAPASHGAVRFAIVSDFGSSLPGNPSAAIVAEIAERVKAWDPDFIVTAGDNNDDRGDLFDVNVGQHFHEYIGNYQGIYGAGSPTNRFFPALGNHDDWAGLSAYCAFFTLPGNERYYEFAAGAARFFVVNSNSSEPDGNTGTSAQAAWLEDALAASTAPWNFVVLHHAPYTSSTRYYGGIAASRWDYGPWGADAVFAGHAHVCERIVRSDTTYFVTGVCGAPTAGFGTPVTGSEFRYGNDHAFMVVDVEGTAATFRYVNLAGQVVDTYTQPVAPNEWAAAAGGSYNAPDNWTRGRTPSAPDAVALLAGDLTGPLTVDAPVTLGALYLQSPGGSLITGPAGIRFETTGPSAMLTAQGGSHQIDAPVELAADILISVLAETVTLSAALDNSAGRLLTKAGPGTLVIQGDQSYAPGSVLNILEGTVNLKSDAGLGGANLAVFVADAVLNLGSNQRLDTLAIGEGGKVVVAGAYTIAMKHLVMGGVDLGAATLTPEPATLALLAVGLGSLLVRRPRA